MIASSQGQWLTSIFFLFFIAVSLGLTVWSIRRSRSASGFFVAGRSLSGWQNGLALSGDYMSAASFLGIAGLVSLFGFDGLLYSFGFIVGWILIVLLVAEPLCNSGKYTLSDVMAYRLRPRPVRAGAVISSVTISLFHLLGQLIGASAIVSLLLPIDASTSIIVIGFLMVSYVLFGGMVATTYVQMVKAVLVFCATAFLTVLLLNRFDFSVSSLMSAAATASGKGDAFLSPGLYFTNKLDLVSLGVGLVLGTAGLPHIMMRFYTVPAAKDARASANWVIGVVGVYLVMTTVLGFGAAALVGHDKIVAASRAGNSAAPLLALYLGGGSGTLGGQMLVAFISAVTFATILAVVAGLLIAAASNVAHDPLHACHQVGREHRPERGNRREDRYGGGGPDRDGTRAFREDAQCGVPGRPGLCGRRERQSTRDSVLAVLAPLQHRRSNRRSDRRTRFFRRSGLGLAGSDRANSTDANWHPTAHRSHKSRHHQHSSRISGGRARYGAFGGRSEQ